MAHIHVFGQDTNWRNIALGEIEPKPLIAPHLRSYDTSEKYPRCSSHGSWTRDLDPLPGLRTILTSETLPIGEESEIYSLSGVTIIHLYIADPLMRSHIIV